MGFMSAVNTSVVVQYSFHSSVTVTTLSLYPVHGSADNSGFRRTWSVPDLHFRKAAKVYFLPFSKV